MNTRCMKIFVIYLCWLILPQTWAAAFVAQTAVENDDVRVSLLNSEAITSPSGHRVGQTYCFEIFDKHHQTQQELVVEAKHTNKLVDLKLYQTTLLIWEESYNGAGDSIRRVNLQTMKIEDWILMYYPAFSLDNRFVVYVGQYPRFLPQNAVPTDIVKVYDFEQSPSENRVNPEKHGIRDVGIPVFPEEDAATFNENFLVYDKERRVYSISPPFLWLNNQQQIVFIVNDDSQGKEGEYANFLVLLDLQDGLRHPHIVRKRIDSSLSSAFRDGITDPIVVKELAEDGEEIVITTHRDYGPRPREIEPQQEKASEQIIRLPKLIFE